MEEKGQPFGYMSVQHEVTRALADPADFLDIPRDAPDYRRKTTGRPCDMPTDSRPARVVCDGSYVSAQWPRDAHTFPSGQSELMETGFIGVVDEEKVAATGICIAIRYFSKSFVAG